jgi:hypothetical protein
MRKDTKPWLADSFTLLSGSRMPGKAKLSTPASFTIHWKVCEDAPTIRLAGSSAAGRVSLINTLKAVSVPVFWKRMV